MPNVGFATMSVIPSLRGFDKSIGGQLPGPMSKAGADAGTSAGNGFRSKFSAGVKVAGIAAAGVLAGGLGAAFAVLKTGTDEAKDASAGVAQLQAGIKSTGNVAKVSVPGMEALASSIQDYSGQTDDSIVKSEQLLLTFTGIRNGVGKGNDIFNQATTATANLAAKMGGDASDSAIQLGKALNDPVKGITKLQRIGVTFTDQQKKQVEALVKTGDTIGAQKIILGELNKEFGGAAKAAGQSIPGQLARAKRAFEDLSQGVVETLLPIALPAVTLLTNGLKVLAPIAQRAVQGVAKGIGGFASTVGGAFAAIRDGFKFFDEDTSGLSKFDQRFQGIGAGLHAFVGQVKDGFAQILPSLQQFGSQLIDLFVNHLVPLFVNFARAAIPPLVSAAQSLAQIFVGSIVPAFRETVDFISTKVIPVVGNVADKLSGFLSFLASHQGAVKTFAKVALGLLAARFAALKINAAVVGVKKFASEIASNVKSVINFGKSVAGAVQSAASFAKSVLLGAANIAKQTAQFVIQKGAALAAAAAQKIMTGAQWLLNAAMDANPIGLIVIGIAALAAGFVLAYKHITPFRNAVDFLGRAFIGVFGWVKSHWPLLLAILTGPIGIAVLVVSRNFDRIKGFVSGALDFVRRNWATILAVLTGPIGLAVLVISRNWERIKAGFSTVVGFIGRGVGRIVQFFTGLPGRIVGAFVTLEKQFFDIGSNIVDGLLNGIKAGWHRVTGWLGEAVDHLPKVVKIALGIHSPSTVFHGIGVNMMDGLSGGIADGNRSVTRQLNAVGASLAATTAFRVKKRTSFDLLHENWQDPKPKKKSFDITHEMWADPDQLVAVKKFADAIKAGQVQFSTLFNHGASPALLKFALDAQTKHPPRPARGSAVASTFSPSAADGAFGSGNIIINLNGNGDAYLRRVVDEEVVPALQRATHKKRVIRGVVVGK